MDIGSIQNSLNQSSTQNVARTPAASATPPAPTSAVLGEQKAVQTGGVSQIDIPRDQVEEAVVTIQKFVQAARRNIDFSVDDASGHVVVKVTDSSSGDVIRQIPSEEALHLAESLADVRSLLFKAEA